MPEKFFPDVWGHVPSLPPRLLRLWPYRIVRSKVVGSASVCGDVDTDLSFEGRKGLDAEVCDRDEDTEHGDNGEHSRSLRTRRFFAQQPQSSLPRHARQQLHLPPSPLYYGRQNTIYSSGGVKVCGARGKRSSCRPFLPEVPADQELWGVLNVRVWGGAPAEDKFGAFQTSQNISGGRISESCRALYTLAENLLAYRP